MGCADEDLRKRRAAAGTIVHLFAKSGIGRHAQFGERDFLARQQRFGGAAIAAAGAGIDFNGGHRALVRKLFGLQFLDDKCLNYMGARWVSTTRANTSTSTCAALARKRARAQASVVAPEVRTSSTSTTRRPSISAVRSGATLKAPCTLLARCGRDSPICCSVARTRRSASEASFTPLWREITRASAPDWL